MLTNEQLVEFRQLCDKHARFSDVWFDDDIARFVSLGRKLTAQLDADRVELERLRENAGIHVLRAYEIGDAYHISDLVTENEGGPPAKTDLEKKVEGLEQDILWLRQKLADMAHLCDHDCREEGYAGPRGSNDCAFEGTTVCTTCRLADACAELSRLQASAERIVENWDALSGPRAHRVGCQCGGSNDGVHTCLTLSSAVDAIRKVQL